jgi:hypothetical protein
VPSGTISVTSSVTGLTFSINGTTYTNTTGIFTGLASGTYNVKAKNSCGNVSSASVAVVDAVPTGRTTYPNTDSTSIVKVITTPTPEQLFEVAAYPNPTNTDFKLNINSSYLETVKVTVYDMTGKAVKYFTFGPKQNFAIGNDLKSGVYTIEVRQGKHVKTIKVVKF